MDSANGQRERFDGGLAEFGFSALNHKIENLESYVRWLQYIGLSGKSYLTSVTGDKEFVSLETPEFKIEDAPEDATFRTTKPIVYWVETFVDGSWSSVGGSDMRSAEFELYPKELRMSSMREDTVLQTYGAGRLDAMVDHFMLLSYVQYVENNLNVDLMRCCKSNAKRVAVALDGRRQYMELSPSELLTNKCVGQDREITITRMKVLEAGKCEFDKDDDGSIWESDSFSRPKLHLLKESPSPLIQYDDGLWFYRQGEGRSHDVALKLNNVINYCKTAIAAGADASGENLGMWALILDQVSVLEKVKEAEVEDGIYRIRLCEASSSGFDELTTIEFSVTGRSLLLEENRSDSRQLRVVHELNKILQEETVATYITAQVIAAIDRSLQGEKIRKYSAMWAVNEVGDRGWEFSQYPMLEKIVNGEIEMESVENEELADLGLNRYPNDERRKKTCAGWRGTKITPRTSVVKIFRNKLRFIKVTRNGRRISHSGVGPISAMYAIVHRVGAMRIGANLAAPQLEVERLARDDENNTTDITLRLLLSGEFGDKAWAYGMALIRDLKIAVSRKSACYLKNWHSDSEDAVTIKSVLRPATINKLEVVEFGASGNRCVGIDLGDGNIATVLDNSTESNGSSVVALRDAEELVYGRVVTTHFVGGKCV